MAGISTCPNTGNGIAPPLTCLSGVITAIITLAFWFVGAVCLIFLLWGAIKFITSSGDPKAVKSARDTMTYAVIGTVIVLGTYAIISLIQNSFLPAGVVLLKIP